MGNDWLKDGVYTIYTPVDSSRSQIIKSQALQKYIITRSEAVVEGQPL